MSWILFYHIVEISPSVVFWIASLSSVALPQILTLHLEFLFLSDLKCCSPVMMERFRYWVDGLVATLWWDKASFLSPDTRHFSSSPASVFGGTWVQEQVEDWGRGQTPCFFFLLFFNQPSTGLLASAFYVSHLWATTPHLPISPLPVSFGLGILIQSNPICIPFWEILRNIWSLAGTPSHFPLLL